jgi:hypothetical protein
MAAYDNKTLFGNFYKPFISYSPWNSRPINPQFGSFVIPKDSYYPSIGEGAYSTGVFEAVESDPPMTFYPLPGWKGINDPDSEVDKPSVTIPHWPASAVPSTSGDGHCDVVDSTTGIIHSFWCLKKVDSEWVCAQYAWSHITGTGWGNPAHHYQGARAAAVPPIGGLIRKHEVNDKKANYEHALSMSLTFSGLGHHPAYIYPATSADQYADSVNFGGIPEGALLMLPPSFDTSKLCTHQLRKIANTLKKYGAYVIDQNSGTPFSIYVENGSGFNIMGTAKGGWNQAVADDMDTIREALRMVTGAEKWVAGSINGVEAPVPPKVAQNVLSMRGPWRLESETDYRSVNAGGAFYDTWEQCLKFPASKTPIKLINSGSRGISKVTWAELKSGDKVELKVTATGGAKVCLSVWGWVKGKNQEVVNTGKLGNGQTSTFVLPDGWWSTFYAESGAEGIESTVFATLIKQG